MAQVMVNFRMDEEVKRSMERACREMGLSMTAAFTIFAKKVGKEKRIPFEIAADPDRPDPYRRQSGPAGPDHAEGPLLRKQERMELLCAEIRRSLTAIHTAIPASIAGISMERIRLLCGDQLKDKTAEISKGSRALFSSRNAGMLREKDPRVLDEYLDGLSAIGAELREIEHGLIPAMRSRQGEDGGGFEPYEQRLASVSQRFDELGPVMQRFLRSTSCQSGARALKARIQQAAAPVETPYVLTALEGLEALILRHHDALEDRTRARLEGDYLQTLELTLRELAQAEQEGGDTGAKAALCLRVVNVMSQTISDGRRARQEWDDRSLEAEVSALERLAAMRGDVGGGMDPED